MDLDLPLIDTPSSMDPRDLLQASWDAATQECGAARVTIVNEIDDERIPSSIDAIGFRYCELDYPGCVGGPCPPILLSLTPGHPARNLTSRHLSGAIVMARVRPHLIVIAKEQRTPPTLGLRTEQGSLRTKM
jgi:hypothetical protein